jgi:hypothetical protein
VLLIKFIIIHILHELNKSLYLSLEVDLARHGNVGSTGLIVVVAERDC